ncbi:MAG: C40 family peptidase [Treponema sp.]|nr:C40 family peptidase [Treponema sp.]
MNSKLSKIIALVLVQCQLAAMLPAIELRTDLRQGMARLEHYLDKAAAERKVQNWEQLAQSGLEAAMYEWESGAVWLQEQDSETWRKEREWAETSYRKEMETAYVRWASERVYSERAGFEGSGLEKALQEAAELWNYENSGQIVNLADAGEVRAAWEQVAAEIVERYLNGWEEQQGAVYIELESRFQDLGLSDKERESLILETAEIRRIEVRREYNRIALAEGNRFMTELLYDQGSMKKLAANEAASVIARELAREAEEATEERARELFNQLDTMISAEAQGDIELSAEDWLNQFRAVFEEALARWEEAELGFLAARSEWEHDAEDAYLAGEESWNQAYLELTERQKQWEAAILLKIDEGFAKWQENQSRLAAELEDARTEFLAAAAESRSIKETMLESQEAIYIRSRQMMDLVNQGIESWFNLWDDKYLMVYTYMKNAIEKEASLAERFAGLDYEVFKNLLTAIDIDDLTNPNKNNAQILQAQIEVWVEACLVLQEREILSSIDELLESAGSLINTDTGWLSLAMKYREFADDSARRLYELAGSAAGNSGDYRGELTAELLKAEALLNYWDKELEVAGALHQYAQETSSTIEDAAKTREELEKAKAAYEESVKDYQGITELISQKSTALERTREDFEKAQAVLAGFKKEVEDAQRDYLNIISAMKEMNPTLVYAELTELARMILDFWKGKIQNAEGKELSLEDTIHTYYQLSHEYMDILHSLEISSLINSLETGSGPGQDGITGLETKAEDARFLSRSGQEEDLRAAAGLYPAELLLRSTWGTDTEGEERTWNGKEFLIELDMAYRETGDPVEREDLLVLMRWVWEEAALYYDEEVLLRKETIEYLKTGTLPDPDSEGAERANLIRERYGQYDAGLQNQKNREAGQRVAELIAALKAGLNTAGEKKTLEYAAELRDAGKGLNESGQEALEYFIMSFLEYAAVRDYENGLESLADRESREKEYQEALTSYTAYDSWRYGIYDTAGLEEITGSAEFAALADEEREWFLSCVELGDTLALYTLIENLRTTSAEELVRRTDALVYTQYYVGEKEENRSSWLTSLAAHRARISSSGIDSKSLMEIEPLFASDAKKTYLEGLEQKIYRIGIWFDTMDEWDQTQYREAAGTLMLESARAALENSWQEFQNGINTDSWLCLMIHDELEKLRYINEGAETLAAIKAEKEEILTAVQKKYNDYANNEYDAAIRAIDQSCIDYNAVVDLADEYYRAMTEARLQLRKKQEIYDWAESVYLKDFGSNYDEYYVTPQEKLVQVQYARERALIAVEVLNEISNGVPARTDANYGQALESYRESRRAYYLAQATAYQTTQSIVRLETIVREAELAEEAARSRLVGTFTSVSPGQYELVNLVDDGNGGYKPVLTYTLENLQQAGTVSHEAVRKPDSEIDGEVFQKYFGDDTAVSIEKAGSGTSMTLAEWEAGEWLKKTMNRGIDYLNDVMLASLYIKYCSQEDSAEGNTWFINGGDPRRNGDYTLGDIPLNTSFHGIDVKTRYSEARKTALQEAYNRVIRQKGGEEDIAYYLLYRDRNLVTGADSREEDLLKSRALQKLSESIGKTHERYVVDVRTYTGIAIGYTAAGTAAAIGAIFIPSLWAISIQSFALAATFYALAGTAEFARKQINSLWTDVKNLGNRYTDIVNGQNSQFRDEYGTWMEAAVRLKAEREKLNLFYYGSAQGPAGEGKTNTLSYDDFRTGLTNLFIFGGNNNTVTFNDAIAVYSKTLYEETNAGAGSTVTGAISILNAALEARSKNQQALMNGEIERLKEEQQGALELYGEMMNVARSIPQDRQAELRALALRAGDPSLDIAERRESSAEYERLISELSFDTEDLREDMRILLDRALGDNSWNSTNHGQNIINLEGELFGSLTRYSRPTEAYTEHEILLLREAGLAALDTDTALRLSVKEQEWGIIFEDFLNQYSAWLEQVDQIRQAGLSEWNKARSRMNEGYNTWRKNFNDEYQAKTAAWDLNYLEFVNEKQIWVEDQYLYAVNVGNSGLFEYAGDNADQIIEQSLAKVSVGRMNRETIDPLSYTDMLLEDSILGELLARADNLAGRGDLGAQKVLTAAKRTSTAGNLAQAAKLIGEMDNDMQKTAAKLAAQQAQQLIEEAISQLYSRLDRENRTMLAWEEQLVQSYGYQIDGQIRRKATVDSALFGNYTVTQTVHRYEFYVPESGPVSGVDLNAATLNGLDADTIMYMAETARLNLDKWGEMIFGRVENNKTVEHQVLRSNGNDDNALVTVRDGALGAHIGYGPLLKDEVSYLHSPLEDAEDPGAGEMGKILLDFWWNGMVSSVGYSEMGKAVYDQKFWAQAYTPGFTAPTIRDTLDFALDITSIALSGVITPFAASLINMVDDLLFSGLDLSFSYRTTDEVMKSLTTTAATSVLSLGFGALGKTNVAKSIVKTFDKFKKVGGDIILKAGSAAIKSYTTTMAVNAIQAINFKTGDFDTKTFTESLYSTETLSGTVSTLVGVGLNGIANKVISAGNEKLFSGLANLGVAGLTEASRYGVYAADSLINGKGSFGERLGQAYEDMGGVTLNIANLGSILDFIGTASFRLGENYDTNLGTLGQMFSGVGLMELNLGLDGTSLSFGTGGIDLAGNLYNTAKHGLDYMSLAYGTYEGSENRDILVTNYLDGDWVAENTSMRIEAGSDILNVVNQGELGTTTVAQTRRQDDGTGRLITIADTGNTNLNAIALQHESWRDGYITSDNDIETFKAVLSHIQMAVKMLNDTVELPLNGLLIDDLMMYLGMGGDTTAFAKYVSENYDSSGDYWKLMDNGTLVNDNSGWLTDERGDPIYKDGKPIGAPGIETGLLNILYGGTSNRAYGEYTSWQIFVAQHAMQASSMTYKMSDGIAFVWPRDRSWTGNTTGQELDMDFLLRAAGNTIADAVFSKLSPGVERYSIDTNSNTSIDIMSYIRKTSEYKKPIDELYWGTAPLDAIVMRLTSTQIRVNTEAALSFIKDQLSPAETAHREIYEQYVLDAEQRLSELQNNPSGNSFGTKLAQAALILAGGRYVWGYENPFNSSMPGVDCSGAILFALQLMGYDLPRVTANDIIKNFTTEISDGTIRPGDINANLDSNGRITHVQTFTDTNRVIDPFGGEANISSNPGVIRYRAAPSTNFVAYRFDLDKIKSYYNPSHDILGGNLSIYQYNNAWQRLLEYSK